MNKLTLSKLKDPIELYNSWGIYSINFQCGLSYIGQTKRGLKFRIKEHQQFIQKQKTNKSSTAKHCWEMNHSFDFNSPKNISKPTSIHELNFLEAFHIYKNYDNIVNPLRTSDRYMCRVRCSESVIILSSKFLLQNLPYLIRAFSRFN